MLEEQGFNFNRYKKFGGWMILFLLSTLFIVLQSIYYIVMILIKWYPYFKYPSLDLMPIVFTFLELFGLVVLFSFIIILLFQKHKHIPAIIQKILLITCIFVSCLSIVVNLLYYFFTPFPIQIYDVILNLLRNIMYTTIWLYYFKQSVRVSIYFNCIDMSDLERSNEEPDYI